MKLLLGKLVCLVTRKHKRGKRVAAQCNQELKAFRCPRCGATWTRKVRKA